MKKYFYADGEDQKGPYTIEELKEFKLTKTTLVWCEGMPDWCEAHLIPELSEILVVIPPPINKPVTTPPPLKKAEPLESKTEDKPKSSENKPEEKVEKKQTATQSSANVNPVVKKKKSPVGWIIAIVLICGLVVCGFIFKDEIFGSGGSGSSNDYYNSGSSNQPSYEEQVKSVQEIEEETPTNFLTADGTYRENLLGDKLVINGKIYSSATSATYKDVVITVYYYSKSETMLLEENYTIYEVIKPNSTKSFELRVPNYSDVASIGWEVTYADVK